MRPSLAIDELAAHRALNALPEVWIDFIHGRLAADEVAAAASSEPDELVERSMTLFHAPSAAEEEGRLEALLAAHFAEPPRRAVPRGIYGGVIGLVAASVLLVWFLGRAPAFDGGYTLELSSGYLDERDEPVAAQGVTRYREGQRITLVLRPRDTVATEVGVVVFAVADGRSTKLAIEPEINEHRVVSIVGTPVALGLPAGRWRLVAVVGPPEHLPSAFEDVRNDAEAPYDVRTEEVEIVPASAPPLP